MKAELSMTPPSPVIKRAPSNSVCAPAGAIIVTTATAADTKKEDEVFRCDMKSNSRLPDVNAIRRNLQSATSTSANPGRDRRGSSWRGSHGDSYWYRDCSHRRYQ